MRTAIQPYEGIEEKHLWNKEELVQRTMGKNEAIAARASEQGRE